MVIMSRSEEKLQKVADEISEQYTFNFPIVLPPSLPPSLLPSPGEKYGREVRMIAVDFSEGQEIYPQIEEQLRDLDIGILGRKTLWICTVV